MARKLPNQDGSPAGRVEAATARARSQARVGALRGLPREAKRLRRVPGIVFADGAAGPRARIAGTGVEVFEVVRDYLDSNRDRAALADIYDWLTPDQIEAALAYYTAYSEEIDERIALDDAFAHTYDRPRA